MLIYSYVNELKDIILWGIVRLLKFSKRPLIDKLQKFSKRPLIVNIDQMNSLST